MAKRRMGEPSSRVRAVRRLERSGWRRTPRPAELGLCCFDDQPWGDRSRSTHVDGSPRARFRALGPSTPWMVTRQLLLAVALCLRPVGLVAPAVATIPGRRRPGVRSLRSLSLASLSHLYPRGAQLRFQCIVPIFFTQSYGRRESCPRSVGKTSTPLELTVHPLVMVVGLAQRALSAGCGSPWRRRLAAPDPSSCPSKSFRFDSVNPGGISTADGTGRSPVYPPGVPPTGTCVLVGALSVPAPSWRHRASPRRRGDIVMTSLDGPIVAR
jgi:hypothetical protein